MVEYLYYILTVIGIGWFITESSLLKTFRENISKLSTKYKYPLKWILDKFEGVVNCIYCCSFWVGIGIYFIMYLDYEIISSILSAFSVLGTIYIIKNVLSKY